MLESIIAVIITLGVFLGSYWKIAQLNIRQQEAVAAVIFALAMISLTGIYYYCYALTQTELHGYFTAILRALYGAIIAVVQVNSDYSGITSVLQTNPVLMLAYWISVMLATYAFVLAIAAIFGRKVADKLRWQFAFDRSLYLIVGCNADTIALGENIATHDAGIDARGADHRQVVRYLAYDKKSTNTADFAAKIQDFGGIISEFSATEYRKCLRKITQKPFFERFMGSGSQTDHKSDRESGSESRRKSRHKSGRKPRRSNHLILALASSYDMLDLLETTKELLNELAQEQGFNQYSLSLHIKADSAFIEAKAEEMACAEYIFDVSSFSDTELLIRSFLGKYPPWKMINLTPESSIQAPGSDTAVPDQSLSVAIIGFDHFGQTFLDYLIQNGQFLGRKMQALVIDKDIELLEQVYRRNRPALDLCCDLQTNDHDFRSNELLQVLASQIDQLNLVFIDTAQNSNSKALGMQIVQDILDLAKLRRDCPESEQLIVVSRQADGLMVYQGVSKMAISEDTLSASKVVFTEANVINADIDNKAKLVNYVYSCVGDDILESQSGEPLLYPGSLAIDTAWQQVTDKFTQDSNRAAAQFLDAIAVLAGHQPGYKDLKQRIATNQSLLNALAAIEHQRWLAFHAVKGWDTMGKQEMRDLCHKMAAQSSGGQPLKGFQKDSRSKKHACLVPAAQLQQVSAYYNSLLEECEKSSGPSKSSKSSEFDESSGPSKSAESNESNESSKPDDGLLRNFALEDQKIIHSLEWINCCTELYAKGSTAI